MENHGSMLSPEKTRSDVKAMGQHRDVIKGGVPRHKGSSAL